jgi:hypothetical protein
MALTFKKYESTATELENLGTVISNLGKKGELKFVPGTIDRFKSKATKALCMILMNDKGESLTVPLSKRVSGTILGALENGQSKKDCLAAIAGLEIVENTDGGHTIVAPRGVGGEEESFTVGELKTTKVAYEDLVW